MGLCRIFAGNISMQDIIQLLPESVANQIAAGEVIQRPASVVKELLENAIDAGADKVTLVVKDAGRELIQVSDNGSGMSDTDARMCFERHATSKLKGADDLFRIQTKGFRGEALASIAAVAQVELKTKRKEDALGTTISISGSRVNEQEPAALSEGSVFTIKKLFFNVPARFAFLKSNAAENSHITEEFVRVALAHPEVGFSYVNNEQEQYHLVKNNLPQRIAALFGASYQDRLVKLDESTQVVSLRGYLVKPEFSRKTRGEQYFFVNNRFIKNHYLHHAIQSAYNNLIPKENVAGYFVFIHIDPGAIDVNIHPTKTEIKFRDEKVVYAILHATVKRALGQSNLTPSLDFSEGHRIEIPLPDPNRKVITPTVTVNPAFNPFETSARPASAAPGSQASPAYDIRKAVNPEHWNTLYGPTRDIIPPQPSSSEMDTLLPSEGKQEPITGVPLQVAMHYLLVQKGNGLFVIDQQYAHERVMYEKFIWQMANRAAGSQQLMFPENIEIQPQYQPLFKEILPELRDLGFSMEPLGTNSWVVNGIPPDASEQNLQQLLDGILQEFSESRQDIRIRKQMVLAAALGRTLSVKRGKAMDTKEITALCEELFVCENPFYTPSGKKIMVDLSPADLGYLIKSHKKV
jgi:DNA mismatch repair protein MutL